MFTSQKAFLEVIVIVWQWHRSRRVHLLLIGSESSELLGGERDFSGLDSSVLDEGQVGIASELASEPQERLLEVVVGLRRDIIVLQVFLAVEGDLFGLDLALLDIALVAAEDDGDVGADTDQILVPVRDVLVSLSGSDIEHDDSALTLNVVTIAKTAELLLTSSVPNVEANGAAVGRELEWANLDTNGSYMNKKLMKNIKNDNNTKNIVRKTSL